jgi:hypothetical protein
MNVDEFRRTLKTFADSPADIDVIKNTCVVQLRDEIIEARVEQTPAGIMVEDEGGKLSADKWIIERIAKIPLLAERISQRLAAPEIFVTPRGVLIRDIEVSPEEQEDTIDDAVHSVSEVLSSKPVGTTNVLFLTSDAGEGKTTLITHLARLQAEKYRKKEAEWLLLPIELGGRTLIRFEDAAIGALVNRLRFQMLYFDSLLELIRMGVIIPALDGFEEMFVASPDEALASVATLMVQLNSTGSLLISARNAFFDVKSFSSQARLIDALSKGSLAYSRVTLKRWEERQFLDYSTKRGIQNSREFYDKLLMKLDNPDHILLTRPFLVKSLIDLRFLFENDDELIGQLDRSSHEFFYKFIATIIRREMDKWVDMDGKPIISFETHLDLLCLIAEEMWIQNVGSLRSDLIEQLASVFGETTKMSPAITYQIKERITSHALLTNVHGAKTFFSFDHEEFRDFFLGRAIAKYLERKDEISVLTLMRKGQLTEQTLVSSINHLRQMKIDEREVVSCLESVSKRDDYASNTRVNCGGVTSHLLDGLGIHVEISDLFFPSNSLDERSYEHVTFNKCFFQTSSLQNTSLLNCIFVQTEFEGLRFYKTTIIKNTLLENCRVVMVEGPEGDFREYSPLRINSILSESGFVVKTTEPADFAPVESDPRIHDIERILRVFQRKPIITENVLKLKCRPMSTSKIDEEIKELKKRGIVIELDYTGAGNQSRFRALIGGLAIEEAFSKCQGQSEILLNLLEKGAKFPRQ